MNQISWNLHIINKDMQITYQNFKAIKQIKNKKQTPLDAPLKSVIYVCDY